MTAALSAQCAFRFRFICTTSLAYRLPLRVTLLFLLLSGCSSSDPPLATAGWLANCSGAAFAKLPATTQGGLKPIFKLTDQLIVEVPKSFYPKANSDIRQPTECKSLKDVPEASFLEFWEQGSWSKASSTQAIPLVNGRPAFTLDSVWIRIERPSRVAISDEQRSEYEKFK
jgi:hypothetical protein